MNASKIARMLLPMGKSPHIIPSIAVGIASEGIGLAGGMYELTTGEVHFLPN